MPAFHAIAAMSENRVIGAKGRIPWHLPEDFRWFKHKTMGGTLVMGRKTFESIGRPLPGRKTIVVSRSAFDAAGVEVVRDLAELSTSAGAWVCGGAEIYRQLLPACHALYLTRVKGNIAGETFMPVFEEEFVFTQIIYETPQLRVEKWLRNGATAGDLEVWPFSG